MQADTWRPQAPRDLALEGWGGLEDCLGLRHERIDLRYRIDRPDILYGHQELRGRAQQAMTVLQHPSLLAHRFREAGADALGGCGSRLDLDLGRLLGLNDDAFHLLDDGVQRIVRGSQAGDSRCGQDGDRARSLALALVCGRHRLQRRGKLLLVGRDRREALLQPDLRRQALGCLEPRASLLMQASQRR